MDTTSDAADARPTTVAFVNCFDATTFGRTVHLTADEERRLRNVLAALRDYGFILEASFEPAQPGYGFADVADHLRASIGFPIANAALTAAERCVPAIDPAPAAVVPVWAFEPEGGSGDSLLSSARLWNTDLLVEALRVEDDDDPTPVPSVRDRWHGVMCDDSEAPQPAGFTLPTVPVQVEQGSLTPTSLGIVATLDGAAIEVVVELLGGAVHVLRYTPADDEPAFSVHLTPSGARRSGRQAMTAKVLRAEIEAADAAACETIIEELAEAACSIANAQEGCSITVADQDGDKTFLARALEAEGHVRALLDYADAARGAGIDLPEPPCAAEARRFLAGQGRRSTRSPSC